MEASGQLQAPAVLLPEPLDRIMGGVVAYWTAISKLQKFHSVKRSEEKKTGGEEAIAYFKEPQH